MFDGRLGVLDGDGATPLALLLFSPLLLLPGFGKAEEEGDVLVVVTGSDGSVGLGHDTSNLEAEVPQCEVHLKYRVTPGAAASSLPEKVWE